MNETRPSRRRQQKAEDLCAAVIRGLTGEADIHYRGRRLHKGRRPLPVYAPHLQLDARRDDFDSYRGVADSIALRLQHSDPHVHREFCPNEPVERLIFELLEQLRVETLAPDSMRGMKRNLHYRFAVWSRAFSASSIIDGAQGILLYTVFQVCRARLTGHPVPEATEGLIETTRTALAPLLGKDLEGLRHSRGEQAAYALHARSIARTVGNMLHSAEREKVDGNESEEEEEEVRNQFRLLLNFDNDEGEAMPVVASGTSDALLGAAAGYRSFTSAYDREEYASALARRDLLAELRARLDRRIAEHGFPVPRLAHRLMQLLAAPQRDGWSFGEEAGYVDGGRLAQLVCSPAEHHVFRLERCKPHADCLVSFLVDCSGSMKQHAEPVTILIDTLVRAMEQAGAKSEVLGFTTGAWNGGRTRRDWMQAGRPRCPGRMNELLHMVFKDADSNWRATRRDLAALLKVDLYREGVDGEAIKWASKRMHSRNVKRRILVVISDGCPMDSATVLLNDECYLENHLREVLARHELRSDIEVCGIGVGFDLSVYYSRSLTIDLRQPLNSALLFEIAELIGGKRRHRR